jgi:AcrR family transcriptional regulator
MGDRVRQRTGGRSARIRGRAHEAALELLAEHGSLSAVTLDSVADRAGVHRSTLYRRWRSTPALVLDALLDRAEATVPVPDTGSFETDLRTVLAAVRSNLEDPVGAALAVVGTDRDADITDAVRDFWDVRLGVVAEIVERATARGEIAVPDASLVVELAVAPLFFRLLVDRRPLDDALVEAVVATLRRGLAPDDQPR